jgi:predicted Zn-dependent peptidase
LQNVNPVLETIQKEIHKISQGELSESDLSAAKEHLIGGIYLASESADGRMMRIAKNEFNFERYVPYEELIASLEKVTLDEVIEITDSIFQEGKISLTTLGPLEEEGLDKSNLQFG